MKKVMVFLAIQFVLALGAYAGQPAWAGAGGNESGDAEAVQRIDAVILRNDAAPLEARTEAPGLPVIDSECIREGEACNIIMDRCCPGLSCQGGLAATCLRK